MKQKGEFTNRFRILKNGKISLVVSALLGSVSICSAAPGGGVVTSGNANINHSGTITTINQSSAKASINWSSFNIAKGETVNFKQPNKNSITLNRVIGHEKSVINGALNANGQVWLINGNGILFGKHASINTSGLLATTKNLSDNDFISGHYNFTGDSSNSIINTGSIEIDNAGYVALVGKSVQNKGSIKAVKGNIQLVGANEYEINLNGNSLVNLKVKKGVLDALVENSGVISNKGGQIYLTTNAVDELLKGVVNNEGIIEANSFEDMDGHIELFAHGGKVKVKGTLQAKDGFIETSGQEFSIDNSTKIEAKEWLIDPVDITIESTGGNDLSGSSIQASFIESVLNGGTGVSLTATNDIYVNENISWSDSLFTLTATNDININAIMNASGTAELTFNGNVNVGFKDGEAQGFKGRVDLTIPTIQINGNTFTVLGNDITALQNISRFEDYVLGANIDATVTSSWNSGAGFDPISYDGDFNGLGHVISNLTINRPTNSNVGLFSSSNFMEVKNLGLDNVNIKGRNNVGGILGKLDTNVEVHNSYVTGLVEGQSKVGGLVGNARSYGSDPVLTNNYTNVTVNGSSDYVGGLVGYFERYSGSGKLNNLYALGTVSGNNYVGGLIGAGDAVVEYSYSKGNVSGNDYVGGLIGAGHGTVEYSYSQGDVSGNYYVGGLLGGSSNIVKNSYATGNISGQNDEVGGLIGSNYGLVEYSYATGNVIGNNKLGGLIGNNSDLVKYSYATGNVTGNDVLGGFIGLNTGNMTNAYATGNVIGNNIVGGFVGGHTAQIQNTYSTGKVIGNEFVGGFAGVIDGDIFNAYSVGEVTGNNHVGGFSGIQYSGTISNSFWDIQKSKQSVSFGAVGKTTEQMHNIATFNDSATDGLDSAWSIEEDSSLDIGTPILSMNVGTPIWKIGTKSNQTEKPSSTPTPDSTPKPKEEVEKVVTPIVNNIVTNIKTPIITAPELAKPSQTFKAVDLGFQGDKVVLVSKPIVGENTKKVTHTEAKNMQGTKTTRVPIGRDSVIELVDSGVTLPDGVEQEFYVVEDKRN